MVELKICPTCGTEYEPKERFCPRDGSALRAQSGSADLVGQVVADRYHVLRKLGEGGMGQVYLAEHVKMGRKSALKVMHPSMGSDPDAISRFNREAANASRINHPHVAAIYDFGETPEGLIYLAMEYVEGKPLADLVEERGQLKVADVGAIVTQTADALQAAHDMGIVHRDLKPDNIMVAKNRDGSDCVKVVDFGIAKAGAEGNQKVTRTGLVVGTPEYMSPEQLAGDKLDGRSDVYSLGLVTFHLLTGTLPFPSESAQESMIMRLTDRPKSLVEMRPEVAWHPELQAVMDRVLARPVAERYQSAPEFARDLLRAVAKMPQEAFRKDGTLLMGTIDPRTLSGLQAPTVPPTRAGSNPPPTNVRPSAPTLATPRPQPQAAAPAPPASSRTPLVLAAALLLVVLAGGGFMLFNRGGDTPAPGAAGTVPPADSALPGAAATSITTPSTATPTQELARELPPPATTPGTTPTTTPAGSRTAAVDEDTLPLGDPREPVAQLIERVNAQNARRWLRRTEFALRNPRLGPANRLHAQVMHAAALSNLERSAEACAELRQVRREYGIMSTSFQQTVDMLLDPANGSCQ